MKSLAHLLHVLNAPEAIALHRIIEDLQEVQALEMSVKLLDDARQSKLEETKSHRKMLREVRDLSISGMYIQNDFALTIAELQTFRTIDTDNSGDIDEDELAEVVERLGHAEDLQAIVDDMDENSDGSISFDEFAGWWQMWVLKCRNEDSSIENEDSSVET